MAYATITPKFQIHLPVEIRKKAGLTSHGRVKIKATKGKITIETPKKEDDILSLVGSIKPRPDIDIDNIRDYIQYAEKGRY